MRDAAAFLGNLNARASGLYESCDVTQTGGSLPDGGIGSVQPGQNSRFLLPSLANALGTTEAVLTVRRATWDTFSARKGVSEQRGGGLNDREREENRK